MHWVWYLLGILIALALIGGGVALTMWREPPSAGCAKAGPQYIRPQCVSITEKYADSSIPTPQSPIYLLKFSNNPQLSQLGGPPCSPMWYAYRYVRLSDGGYGPLSAWTTQPIYAGAPNPPCAPVAGVSDPTQYCSAAGIATGCGQTGSASYNQPVVGTVGDLELSMSDGYILNLHRQVGTFDPSSEGDLVGQLLTSSKTSSPTFTPTSFWYDISFNTNPQYQRCCVE